MTQDTAASGTEMRHTHRWEKEGPVAMKGRTGTEMFLIYTCAVAGCDAWKKRDLLASDCVDEEMQKRGQTLTASIKEAISNGN